MSLKPGQIVVDASAWVPKAEYAAERQARQTAERRLAEIEKCGRAQDRRRIADLERQVLRLQQLLALQQGKKIPWPHLLSELGGGA